MSSNANVRRLAFRSLARPVALSVALAAIAALTVASLSLAAPPSTAPSADFPAFQLGGPLVGVAPDAPAPPLKPRWTFKTQKRTSFEGGPIIVADTVYIADDKGFLHALDLANGRARWTFEGPEGFLVTPLYHDGIVYLGDTIGNFFAIDAKTGQKKWEFDAQAGIHCAATLARIDNKDAILFGTDLRTLFCLGTDGKKRWTAETGDRINSPPAVAGDAVFLAACDGKLRKLDLATGKELAAIDAVPLEPSPPVVPSSPVLQGDSVIVGTDKGRLVCFDQKTLKQQWSYEGFEDEAMVFATPAVTDALVIAPARDHVIHAVDRATGKRKWIARAQDDVDTPPVIAAGRVYTASRDKKLYVLDLKTGERLFAHALQRPIAAPLALTPSVVVVADIGGTVICFESAKP